MTHATSSQTLEFGPDNWMDAQTATLSGFDIASKLEFSDAHLGTAEISNLAAMDRHLGGTVQFDRPMLSTKPTEFVRYDD